MAFGKNKKKQDDSGASYFDNVGKTEAVGGNFGGSFGGNFGGGSSYGGNFGATEAVPNGGWGGNQVQGFGSTGPVGGTIPVDNSFIPGQDPGIDEIGATEAAFVIPTPGNDGAQPVQVQPVVGWLVCEKGKNIGRSFQIYTGYNQVGREVGQIVIPDEPQISRNNHMIITYDPRGRAFYIGAGDGRNIIYVNGRPLYGGSGAELHNYDVIDTGGVLFRFIGFCGEQFSWE